MKPHKFAWVGDGQLSRTILPALIERGHRCSGWYVRRPKGEFLALRAQPLSKLRESKCEIVYLAVSDSALSLFSSEELPKSVACVHFSATSPLDVLQALRPRPCGLCYPLQSFATSLPSSELSRVPFFVESTDKVLRSRLTEIVSSLGAKAQYISEKQLLYLHLSAVLANNFTNHLLRCAKMKLEEANLSFELLRPLMEQSLRQIFAEGPEKSQSGPAKRGDSSTCRTQEAMLEENSFLLQIYKLFSKDIRKHYFYPTREKSKKKSTQKKD